MPEDARCSENRLQQTCHRPCAVVRAFRGCNAPDTGRTARAIHRVAKLFAVQYVLVDLEWTSPLKFVVASAIALAGCLPSYQLLVRHTPLRRFVG